MRLFYTKKSSSECTFWNQLLVLHHWAGVWIRSLMKKTIMSDQVPWLWIQLFHGNKHQGALMCFSGFSRGQNALITCIMMHWMHYTEHFWCKMYLPRHWIVALLQWCAELLVLRRRSRTAPTPIVCSLVKASHWNATQVQLEVVT